MKWIELSKKKIIVIIGWWCVTRRMFWTFLKYFTSNFVSHYSTHRQHLHVSFKLELFWIPLYRSGKNIFSHSLLVCHTSHFKLFKSTFSFRDLLEFLLSVTPELKIQKLLIGMSNLSAIEFLSGRDRKIYIRCMLIATLLNGWQCRGKLFSFCGF